MLGDGKALGADCLLGDLGCVLGDGKALGADCLLGDLGCVLGDGKRLGVGAAFCGVWLGDCS